MHRSVQVLWQLEISASELQQAPKHHAAFVVASCLAVNEISLLQRAMLLALNSRKQASGDDTVQLLAFANVMVVARAISAKVVEYVKMVEKYSKALEKKDEDTIGEMTKEQLNNLRGIRKSDQYKFAEYLRNKFTNHYDIREIDSITTNRPAEHSYSIWLHEKDGNTYYSLGEELVMMGALSDGGDAAAKLDAWQDWVLEACRTIGKTHTGYLIQVLDQLFPYKKPARKRLSVDASLVGQLQTSALPLFWDFKGAVVR